MNRQRHQGIIQGMDFIRSPGAIVLIFCFLQGFLLTGQKYTVQLIVTDSTEKDEIFIAGNFNDWQTGNPQYRLETLDSIHKAITLHKLPPMSCQFKFTRGTWGTVEVARYGLDRDDRILDIKGDTLIYLNIEGWVDDFVDFSEVPDSLKISVGRYKSYFYKDKNVDSCLKYATLTYEISHRSGDKNNEIISMIILGDAYQKLGKMDKALELFLSAFQTAEVVKDSSQMAAINEYLGNIYNYQGDDQSATQYYREALRICPFYHLGGLRRWSILYSLSKVFFDTRQLDSAEFYAQMAIQMGFNFGGPLLVLGDLDRMTGKQGEAMTRYRNAVIAGNTNNNLKDVADAYHRIGLMFKDQGRPDSAIYYSRKAYQLALQIKNPFNIVSAGNLIVDLFAESNQLDSAFIYQQTVLNARDSLYNLEKTKQIQSLAFNEQLRRQEIKVARQQFQNKIRIYGLLGILLVFLIIVFMLWRSNRQRQQAYTLLQAQKQATDTQKTFAEQMLDELKSTQKQLIQSEKMASLGELTSGIAHEIKNPLNFINNFSELNMELISEMEEDQNNGSPETNEAQLKLIIKSLKKNSEKINHHGLRIDSIVKGMLQHSRLGNQTKENVNINNLCEDSLNLAYHGFRSKEKTFNARYELHLDPELPQLLITPQDIGRALLNLIDNAFYAVHQKYLKLGPAALQEKANHLPDQGKVIVMEEEPAYQPVVRVRTQKLNQKILITISDNGLGMSSTIISKVFQPFFTTKPTGEGTGLGLSMAYDIITKGHGGELLVKSTEGVGTDFEIVLPINLEFGAGANVLK